MLPSSVLFKLYFNSRAVIFQKLLTVMNKSEPIAFVFSTRCVAWKVCDPASWVSVATVCDREHTPESAYPDWSISRLASSPDAFQPMGPQNQTLNTCVHDFNSGHWVHRSTALCQAIAMGCRIISNDIDNTNTRGVISENPSTRC